MFLPDVDFGFACGTQTKVFVKKNGAAGPLKEVKLPPNSKLSDLFEKSSKVLDLECPQRAYYSNGVECTDIDHIEEDEVIHISCGEPFKLCDAGDGKGGGQVVGNYIIHEKLGQGGFGSVMKGVHSETGEGAAIKFVPKNTFRQFSDLQRVFQEIQALRNLRHPNIIRILDVADNPDSICFIMEYAAGGELRGYVEKHNNLSEEESRSFFKQIVRAVHYIHSKKIIHRDLKLENILLDRENRCKIVDFGLSDYVSGKDNTVTDAGTEAYLAPEVYNGRSEHSDPFKIDSWALGVILYAMTHGKLPFSRPDHETCVMLDKGGLNLNEDVTRSYAKLTRAMLTPSPDKRSSVDAISVDPWVTMHRFAFCDEVHSDTEALADGAGSTSEPGGQGSPRGEGRPGRRVSRSKTMPETSSGPIAPERPGRPSKRDSVEEAASAGSSPMVHASSPPGGPADRRVPSTNTAREGGGREGSAASPRLPRAANYDSNEGNNFSPRDARQQRDRKAPVLPSLAGRRPGGGAVASRVRDVSASRRGGAHK